MVGVANSAGCVTCRSRKVKCDLQRPACGKCVKAGRECGGYRRDRVFIIGTQDDRGRCSSHPKRAPLIPRSSNRRAAEQTRSHSSSSSVTANGWISSGSQSPSSTASTISDTNVQRRPSPSPQPLVQAAFANLRQFIAQNTEDFLMGPMFEADPKSIVPSLLYYLPEMASTNQLFNRGILAFCLGSAGKRYNDSRLNKASLKMSVDAMREMQTTILDPSESRRVEVVAATICMSDCEILHKTAYTENNQYYNWQGLVRGTAALVQERGPLSFAQYPDYQIFTRNFRGSGVLEAIGRRQHTYLASPEWLTLPWSRGIRKGATELIFDIMAQIAGCLADVDLVTRQATHEPSPDCPCETDPKRLLKRLFELADAFTDWFQNIQDEFETLCTIMPTEPSNPNPFFPLVFSFPNFRIGMLHMYMWSSLILIYDATEKLHNYMETGDIPISIRNPSSITLNTQGDFKYHSNNITTPPARYEESYYMKMLREYSRNICQSLDSLLEMALSESWSVVHMLAYPLWIVMQCYQTRSEEESQFLTGFLKKMVDNDIGFAVDLCNMSFEEYARS